jgi:hypothetical protein
MTWFVQLQFVNQMRAAREVEANHAQLERLAAGQVGRGRRDAAGLARRTGARLAVAVGRIANRVAGALDSEAVRAA